MTTKTENSDERLETAKALVASLEAGNDAEAEQLIQSLSTSASNDELFVEVGRLTRELHDAINGFLLDAKISDMTSV